MITEIQKIVMLYCTLLYFTFGMYTYDRMRMLRNINTYEETGYKLCVFGGEIIAINISFT